jgi:hypothetical protein
VSARSFGAALVLTVALAPGVSAQVVPARADTAAADTLTGPSPRSAFIRSLVVPGWGQASVDSYTRGGVFFALQTTSGYMLFRTIGRVHEARDREQRRVSIAVDSLEALMAEDTAAARRLSDPVAFQAAIDEDPDVAAARALVTSRRRHRQDWITYTLFFTMMSGVDAYVTAHLRGFPVELSGEPRRDGSFALGVTVPLGRRR